MIPKALAQIEEGDLRRLVDQRIREGLRLEYKLEIGHDADGKRNLLKQVCSFANTLGGDLVVGIEADPEDNALSVGVPGVSVSSPDEETLWLLEVIRSGAEPRLDAHNVHAVPLESGHHAFVIRVRQSWKRPHRVMPWRLFYGRTSAGAYELEVPEVRRAFLLSEGHAERLRSFVADRLIRIRQGDTTVPLAGRARAVLHLIPLTALDPGSEILSTQMLRAANLQTLTGGGGWGRLTVDGYVRWWPDEGVGESPEWGGVVKLFRSGAIEAVDAARFEPDGRLIPSLSVEQDLVRATHEYLEKLAEYEVPTPIYLFLNFIGMKGRNLGLPHALEVGVHRGLNVHPFDRDHIAIPEVVITGYDVSAVDLLRPGLDRFWNGIGIDRSPHDDVELTRSIRMRSG